MHAALDSRRGDKPRVPLSDAIEVARSGLGEFRELGFPPLNAVLLDKAPIERFRLEFSDPPPVEPMIALAEGTGEEASLENVVQLVVMDVGSEIRLRKIDVSLKSKCCGLPVLIQFEAGCCGSFVLYNSVNPYFIYTVLSLLLDEGIHEALESDSAAESRDVDLALYFYDFAEAAEREGLAEIRFLEKYAGTPRGSIYWLPVNPAVVFKLYEWMDSFIMVEYSETAVLVSPMLDPTTPLAGALKIVDRKPSADEVNIGELDPDTAAAILEAAPRIAEPVGRLTRRVVKAYVALSTLIEFMN